MSLVNDLKSIQTLVKTANPADLPDSIPKILDPVIADLEYQQRVVLDPMTKAVCTSCGNERAPLLFFRRRQGLYELLCINTDGSGCYNNSARVLCQYVDHDTVNCTQLAESEITVGDDNLKSFMSCNDHIGKFIGNATSYKVFPLDEGR